MKQSLLNFFENLTNPVNGTEAIRQFIFMLILFEWIHWTEAQTIGFLAGMSALLALFVRGKTVSNTRVDQKVEELVLHRELAGTTGTGTGIAPSTAPPSTVV